MSEVYHILLVEDDYEHVYILQKELERLDVDYNLDIVKHKQDFLKKLEQSRPDIVICDFNLPDFTGFEALKHCQNTYSDLPFILISAYLEEHEAVQAMKYGACDYVLKDNISRLVPAVTRELINAKRYRQAREELQEKQNLLNKAYKLADIGHWEMDVESREVYWSDNVKVLHEVELDYEPTFEEAIQFYKEGVHRQEIIKAVEHTIEKGEPFEMELKIVTAKGNDLWVSVKGEREIKSGGQGHIFGSIQNIHHKRQMQEELKKAEQKLRDIVEHSTNMFYRHDANRKLTYLSPQCIDFLGYNVEQAKQSTDRFITDHPINKESIQHTMRAIETGERQPQFEMELKKKNGDRIWVKVNEAPIIEEGKTIAIVGSLTDITQQKLAEEELKLSEQRFKSLVQDGTDQIAIIDEEGRYIYVAPLSLKGRNLSIDSDRYLGRSCFQFIHDDDRERVYTALQSLRVGEKIEVEPYRFQYPDGSWVWLETSVANLINNPAVQGIVTTSRDITDRIKRDKELKETLKEKETLLLEIHHRVKNNLAVVSGMMQLQAFEEEDPSLQKKLYDSMSRIQTMSSIHELLYKSHSFSRLLLGNNIKKLISSIIQSFQTNLDIEVNYKLDNTELNINQAVPLSLIINEVITNILKHAYDQNDCGIVEVMITENNGRVDLSIIDDGKGLPNSFNNMESVSSLGMSLIKALSDQLDASIDYYSKNGHTNFKMSFQKYEARGSSSMFTK
ncbi:MAG: PAS domain S-box protein [Balneolaceae bacterium]|nr:PAS domain S-box protein [Balneolaceae bacterium]